MLRASCQDISEVLSGVLPSSEEQGDTVSIDDRHNARRKHARTLWLLGSGIRACPFCLRCHLLVELLVVDLSHQFENLGRRIVIVQDGPLGALVDQLTVNRLETVGRALDDFPLRGCGQRNAHAGLQPFEAIEGQACSILDRADHRRCRLVVLLAANPVGGRGREDLATQVAAQALLLVHRGGQRCHAHDTHEHRRIRKQVDLPLLAFGARIAAVQRGVRHLDLGGTRVRRRTIAAMPRSLRLVRATVTRGACVRRATLVRSATSGGVVVDDLAGLLRARPEQHLAQPLDRRPFRRKLLCQEGQSVDRCLERGAVCFTERPSLGPFDNPEQLRERQVAPPGRRGMSVSPPFAQVFAP